MSRFEPADAEAARLDARLLDFIAHAPAGFTGSGPTLALRYGMDDAEFGRLQQQFAALALALYEYQIERVPPYRAFAAARPVPHCAGQIPALPVDAFKRARIAAFPPAAGGLEFHTSGTTAGQSGVLHLDNPLLYDAALERGFRHHVLPDRDRMRMLILVGSRDEMPYSSLAYMLDRVCSRWGAPGSAVFVRDGAIDSRALGEALRGAERDGEPVCLLGTAFAWVHVLEHCAREKFRVRLPAGSRLMETGGYKGRSRELSREDLYGGFTTWLGIAPTHIVSEYGMTELGSQYYTTGLRAAVLQEPLAAEWSYPAWLRPRVMDSESGAMQDLDIFEGLGLLAHHDLANRGSVAHVLTADLATVHAGRFQLAGRSPRASVRGCGLVYENPVGTP